jgi:hypothetical protein
MEPHLRTLAPPRARLSTLALGFGLALLAGGVLLVIVALGYFIVAGPQPVAPWSGIRVTDPLDGAVLTDRTVTLRGTSSPGGAEVYRVLGEGAVQPVQVDHEGNWEYTATLVEGANYFTFYLDIHYGYFDSVTVFYEP